MNCPNCQTTMQGEDAPVAKFYGSEMTGVIESLTGEKSSPGMHYYCSGCDSEWVWIKKSRYPRLRMIDGGNRALERSRFPR